MNQSASNFDDNLERAQRSCSAEVDSQRFQCPACRARQSLQNDCRRCGADLSLIVAARRRAAYLKEQLRLVREGSTVQQRLRKELRMISGKVAVVEPGR